jgi:hypothetical protein
MEKAVGTLPAGRERAEGEGRSGTIKENTPLRPLPDRVGESEGEMPILTILRVEGEGEAEATRGRQRVGGGRGESEGVGTSITLLTERG